MKASNRIEPGLLVIFRYFASVATLYFAVIVLLTAAQEGTGSITDLHWSLLNFLLDLALFMYLSLSWQRIRNASWYLPLALAVATALPLLTNILDYLQPAGQTLSLIILRSWLLFPILLVPLALIAWQYSFRYVLLFAALTAGAEELMLLPIVGTITMEKLSILGLPLIRAFSFGIIGQIVSHLMETQRAQMHALLRANLELNRQAGALEQLTISRERNRLAGELHDTLAHSLSALSVSLEAMSTALPPGDSELHAMLAQALRITREGLTDTRRALKAMRSDILEELGLPLALRNLSETAAAPAGLRLTLSICEGISGLDKHAEEQIYRIAQEAIHNVIRHAGASRLQVTLEQEPDMLLMQIEDDGVGFDPDQLPTGEHFGLTGMRERAKAIPGLFRLTSQKGKGTILQVRVPMRHD